MFRIAVVEDSMSDYSVLKNYLDRYEKENQISFHVNHFTSAINLLDNYKPDYHIIFMDIGLSLLNGMEASRKLREKDSFVTLIFVTNMARFAIKGYEVNAFDFIVKPVSYFDFALKLKKALSRIRMQEKATFAVQSGDEIIVLHVSQLLYVEVMKHRLIFHTENGLFEGYGSLTAVEGKLPKRQFSRCKNCYLVNLQQVERITGDAVAIGKEYIPISRSKKQEFMEALTEYLVKDA